MPWSEADRAKYEVIRARYSSDMSEAELALIAPLLPPPKRRGRKPHRAASGHRQRPGLRYTDSRSGVRAVNGGRIAEMASQTRELEPARTGVRRADRPAPFSRAKPLPPLSEHCVEHAERMA